ncbi:MAG TPA: DUF2950 family protein [Planctomycetota bacterium]|nr:DUF2950 family protein [Planctomycetota bacterium]
MKASGFTLIELMIVVAIIALIAAIAIPSMLRSRMTANEASAVASCKVYVEAQAIYRRTDFDQDGVLEYAQALQGANSLLETTAGSKDLAYIDVTLARAEGNPGVAINKAGYVFRVLTSQGSAAEGGVQNYLSGTNMTVGFGLSGVPDGYDSSGVSSFLINSNGVTRQKDRGVTASTAHETFYNPDATWAVSE